MSQSRLQMRYKIIPLEKKVPLRISRGVVGEGMCIQVNIFSAGIEGWGAACPFSIGSYSESTEDITTTLNRISLQIRDCNPFDQQKITRRMCANKGRTSKAAQAAVDTALHDWLGKRVELPLWKLWGLDPANIPPTSVTIGMEPPETISETVKSWKTGERSARRAAPREGGSFAVLKVKLGDPKGIDADKERVNFVLSESDNADIIVDANAGWNIEAALEMCRWLRAKGVKVVEQPLAVDAVQDWRHLHENVDVSLFADESCFYATDVPALSEYVDGVVIKLMKCGGLGEAFRIIHTARSCGLSIMLGCYGDTAISNSAMAQIAPLVDYVDLDSHFNLKNDPFEGASLKSGRLVPNHLPGIGVREKNA